MPGVILGYKYKRIPVKDNINVYQVVKHRVIRFFNSSGAINSDDYYFDSYKRAINRINKSKK